LSDSLALVIIIFIEEYLSYFIYKLKLNTMTNYLNIRV